MAFTEAYVTTTGAGDHDGTAEAHAWSFAEMISAAPAAETRVNIKAGAYSIGATTLPANGTAPSPIVLRGYNATIGDLDGQKRGADGTLNTANMPDITITGLWTPSSFCYLQNLDIVGALSSALIGTTSVDDFGLVNCSVTNSQDDAAARALQGDDRVVLINCDFACTGASHNIVVQVDNTTVLIGCRFTGTLNTANLVSAFGGCTVNRCVFIGMGNTSVGLYSATVNAVGVCADSTFYNCGVAISTRNLGATAMVMAIVNCHITDCAKYLDNLYAATASHAVVEFNNRTRDNTTPRTGILSAVLAGEVTTDGGDYTTDYISATNLRLKSTAPGKGTGLMPYTDIGAHGCAAPTIPAEEDVETGVEYGYADDLQTGTYAGGGGGGGASGFPRRVMKLG